jgi:hypothetical protein
MGKPGETSALLAPQRAFVVQFRADANVTAGRMAGRVEHVVSGRSERFSSMTGLWAFIEKILSEVNTQRQEGASPDVIQGRHGPSPTPTKSTSLADRTVED